MRDAGMAGIEVHHSDHNVADRARYQAIADKYELAPSGGSDFHGAPKPQIGCAMPGWPESRSIIPTTTWPTARAIRPSRISTNWRPQVGLISTEPRSLRSDARCRDGRNRGPSFRPQRGRPRALSGHRG